MTILKHCVPVIAMESDAQMADAELEQLLLEEPVASEQIASMKASIDRLVGTVQEMAQKTALQVRISQFTIRDKVSVLMELPTTVAELIRASAPSEDVSSDAPDKVRRTLAQECAVIEGELEKLDFVQKQLKEIASKLNTTLADALDEYSVQAEHDDRCMRELAELLAVSSTEVVGSVKQLLEVASRNGRENGERQDADPAKVLQERASSARAATEVVVEQLNRQEFENVEYHATFDPIAAAQGKLRSLPNELMLKNSFQQPKTSELQPKPKGGRLSPPMPQSRHQGEYNSGDSPTYPEFNLAKMFAAMTLPEVETFDDSKGNRFSEFVTKFRMKYEGLGLSDEMLNHLLFSKLDGYPRVVAEALPRSVREGSFETMVRALTEKFKENDSATQIKAYMALKTLRKRTDISSYCVELERLTQKAYPRASEAELSCTRAGELVAQLVDWPEYLQLYTTMELAPRECAYEMVKSLAQRCERSRELARTAKATTEALRPRTFQQRKGSVANVVESQSRTSQRPMANETEEGDGSEKRKKKQPKCFNCNESGHFRRDCKAPRKVGESDKTTAQRRKAEGPKVFTASLDKWLCGAVESAWRKDGLVGERTVRNVNLLGLSKKALLDTGSQISIVPLEMLRAAREAGFDLNADVEEVPIRCQDAVYDASGNRMRFKGAVQLTLQLEGDAKQRVSLFVMAGGDDMIVLGTNALHLLGFGLTKVTESPYLQPHPNERGKCLTANSAGTSQREQRKFADTTTVVVSRRAYIRPGETKLVTIKCNQKSKEGIVWSDNDLIPDMVCTDLGNTVDVAVSNNSTDARILRAGQKVGNYEPIRVTELEPVRCQQMLERTAAQVTNREQELLDMLTSKRGSKLDEDLEKLVKRFADVFAVSEQELTQTALVEHTIETGDAKPIKQKARPIPMSTRVELRRILNDLQERKIIESSKASWASPIVLVQKKDGTLRLCVDYRKVNQVTKVDSYPLPTIDTMLQSLRGRKFFSTLDLSSGYWQIALSESAKEKSAFTTTEGLYQFRVLPFGLSSSPAVFQRLMHLALGELLGEEVFCYLDDVMIATETEERHRAMLEKVFAALRAAGLKLNPKKCVLGETKVEFLGHVIDGQGLHMDPAKVQAVVNYRLPRSRSELRTFLGMCSYYRKFVLGFSKVAAPLHELTSEKAPFEWTSTRRVCFNKLKEIITTAPVLAQPDIEGARSGRKPFKIYTDASYEGLGAVLSQEGEDGLLHRLQRTEQEREELSCHRFRGPRSGICS